MLLVETPHVVGGDDLDVAEGVQRTASDGESTRTHSFSYKPMVASARVLS